MTWLLRYLLCLLAHVTQVSCLRVGIETPLGQQFVTTYWGPTYDLVINSTQLPSPNGALDAPFERYASEAGGAGFGRALPKGASPPELFDDVEMVAIVHDDDVYPLLPNVDLIFGSASLMNCLPLVANYSALASIIQFERGQPSTVVGGIIFVRADSDIYKLSDVRGKSVSLPQISYQVSAQAQWSVLKAAGVDLFTDTKFVLATISYADTIMAVETGLVDVGLVRSGQLEGFTAVSYSNFRILNLQNTTYLNPVTLREISYEWPTSVVPQPTSVLMVNQDTVDPLSRAAIATALMSIDPTSQAAILGNYTGWFPPQDYIGLYQSQVELGVVRGFENVGGATCIRNADIYDFITCPPGWLKGSAACGEAFPSTYSCVKNPCVKPMHIAVIWWVVIAFGLAALVGGVVIWCYIYFRGQTVNRCDRRHLTVGETVVGHNKMGEVRRGLYYNTPVVIKPVRRLKDRHARRSTNDLIRQASHFHHPHVMPLLGTVIDGGIVNIVVPYEWYTLHDILYNHLMPLSSYQKYGILRTVVSAVTYLHENGLYGRKLGSADVFLDEAWTARLGISFFPANKASRLPPELQEGGDPTAQSDVYALGMLIYEVLYRKLPYKRMRNMAVGAVAPSGGAPPNNDEIHKLMRSCWATEPAKRPTMQTVARVVRGYHHGSLADEYTQDRTKNKGLLRQRLPHNVSHQIQQEHIVTPCVHRDISMLSIGIADQRHASADFAYLHGKVKALVEEVAALKNVVSLRTTNQSFMLVSNLHMPQTDHLVRTIATALEIQQRSVNLVVRTGKHNVTAQLKMGVHRSCATAMVLGRDPAVYCLVGRDVVTTFLLQECCDAGEVQMCSEAEPILAQLPFQVHVRVNTVTKMTPRAGSLQTIVLSPASFVSALGSITGQNGGASQGPQSLGSPRTSRQNPG